MRKRKIVISIFIAAAIAAAGLFDFSRKFRVLAAIIGWIDGLGPAAPFVFVLTYAVIVMLCIPSPLLSFASGFLFNFWQASLLSTLGSSAGSVGAFLIGRYLVRAAVEKRAAEIPEFQRLTRLVKKKGWKIVILARLSPLFPFFIGNYLFGTTRMSARQYFFASFTGTFPSAMVCAYSGMIAGDLAVSGSHTRTPWEWGLLAAGLGATLLLSLYIRRLAMSELSSEKESV